MAGSPQSFRLTRNDSALPIPTRGWASRCRCGVGEDKLDVESAQDLRGDAAVAIAVLGTPALTLAYWLDYVAYQLRAHAHFLSHQPWLDRNVSLVLHALGWDTAN
jgi:hypothetical protein